MNEVVVFSSCTAAKDDSVPVGGPRVEPSAYVGEARLLRELLRTRHEVLSLPETKTGVRETYAFDLYVRKGRMYGALYADQYQQLKQALVQQSVPVQWFFLSGGYGIVHALEPVRSYRATFDAGIARQNGIPCTAKIFNPILSEICGNIMARHPGCSVYVFGSQAYTRFIKTVTGDTAIKIFEGSVRGGNQLSPVLAEFVRALLSGQLASFDERYPDRFVKLDRESGRSHRSRKGGE